MQVIAHRGGALLWPENSRAACEGSVALGVDQLQVDIHLSRDGEVVVIHDATLDRTTDGTGPVGDRTWLELQRLRLHAEGGRMLRLEDVVAIIRPSRLRLRLEVKRDQAGSAYPGFPERIAAVLHAAGFQDRTVVTAFQADIVAAFAPGLDRAWLLDAATLARDRLPALLARAVDHGFPTIGLRWTALDPDGRMQIRSAGLRLCCFGCNDPASIAAVSAFEAEEMSTDRPDLAMVLPR